MSFIKTISINDIPYEININGIMKLNLNGTLYNLGLDTSDGNIRTTDEIVQGQIAYSKGKKYTGTLPDRNTVGRNSAIGVNQNYPLVALNKGSFLQYTMALDRKEYFCICVPKGYYNGNSYVGILKSEIPK